MEFKLEVFYKVAQRLSFTKASEELFISQPAVTRHIRELETHYKCTLFERSGNRKIKLTTAGEKLFRYVVQLATINREMDFVMSEISHDCSGEIRIGASSTISQYVLPKQLANFHRKFPHMRIFLTTGNSDAIQKSLLAKEIDLGIVEGAGNLPELKYENYLKDELVLICRANHPIADSGKVSLSSLLHYSWVLRENGSGSLKVLMNYLATKGVKITDLKIAMQLGSTESIKGYLQESDSLAFVSIHAIGAELQNGTLQMVEVEDFNIERSLRFIELYGYATPNTALLKRFLKEAIILY